MATVPNRPDPSKPGLSAAKQRLLEQRLHRKGRAIGGRDASYKRPGGEPNIASPGQKRIWLVEQLNSNSAAYNISSSYDFHGSLDCKRLEEALNKVVSRHESLRSTFYWSNDELYYRVSDELRLQLIVESSDNLAARAQAHARTLFDLKSGPLLKLVALSDENGAGRLVLVVHHIVFDEWSLGVFWKEFQASYDNDKGASLSPTEYSYSDFAYWQNDQLAKGGFDSQLQYWKSKLADPPSPLRLSRASNAIVSNASAIEAGRVDAKVSRSIKQIARRLGVSTFTVLLLAYKLLLRRYSSFEDIVVGVPIANRSKREFANLIGFCLNTAAIRCDLQDQPTVEIAVKRVGASLIEALENQDIPFDIVADAVQPERIGGGQPLAQTMFVYQSEAEFAPELILDKRKLTPVFTNSGAAKFDLTFFATDSESEIECFIEYKKELFDEVFASRILEHYTMLLHSIAADPSEKVSKLSMLSERERRVILEESKGPSIPIGDTPSLPEQIREQSRLHPDAVALATRNECLTYGKLQERANSLAAALLDQSAPSDQPVAIFMERSAEAITAILAVLQAGLHYLPIDPSYPKYRYKTILEDAQPSIILTTENLRAEIDFQHDAAILVDWEEQSLDRYPVIKLDQLAYIIYTSGSTGQPKGVAITHDNLRYSNTARAKSYPQSPKAFLLLSSLAFDSSVAGLFWTLSSGGKLVLPDPGEEKDPDRIRHLISRHEVTTLLCIPGLYREILTTDTSKLESLQSAIVAGEACSEGLVDAHFSKLESRALYNEYGPTEATVWSTFSRLYKDEPVTIGSPIPNCGAYILNEFDQLQPNGIPGELGISGPGLAAGYYKNDRLTDERFCTLRIEDENCIRIYRTGDKVQRNRSSELEFLGRVDNQVKIRGFRLELGEVENALEIVPGIEEAVATAVSDLIGEDHHARLVAFFVASKDPVPSLSEIMAALAKTLPRHAIPSQIIQVPTFPRSPNGKIDHSKLAIPARDQAHRSEFVEPSGELEIKLVSIWEEVLSLDRISTGDDFFDLGGTSLLAIRLFSRIREDAGMKASASMLLASPTIEKLAKTLERENRKLTFRNLVKLQEGADFPPLFLVHAAGQELLFYNDLVKRLDDRIPIWGVQPIGHDGSENPVENMDFILERYISEMKEAAGPSPFSIAGHCHGGLIAVELARRLKEGGFEVPMLISIDGSAPQVPETGGSVDAKNKRPLNPSRIVSAIKWRYERYKRKARHRIFLRIGSEEQRSYAIRVESFHSIHRAVKRCRSQPYPDEMYYLRCTDSEVYGLGSLTDWEKGAPKAEIIEMESKHEEILTEPYVQDTARFIIEKFKSANNLI